MVSKRKDQLEACTWQLGERSSWQGLGGYKCMENGSTSPYVEKLASALFFSFSFSFGVLLGTHGKKVFMSGLTMNML